AGAAGCRRPPAGGAASSTSSWALSSRSPRARRSAAALFTSLPRQCSSPQCRWRNTAGKTHRIFIHAAGRRYSPRMNPLSGVLGEAWRMYRAHAAHLITIAVGIYLVAAIIEGLLYLANNVVGAIVGALVSIVAAFLVQAALVKAAQDIRDGRADLT